MKAEDVNFDEGGLVPAVVQDVRTREVLTLAYMNRQSLQRTIETGETWFWSRSRKELWHKGATSGHTQAVTAITADCDGDTLVISVTPKGPACHTGARSCFHDLVHSADKSPESTFNDVLNDLYALIESRKQEMPGGSYTTYLFDQGLDKILKKLGEEAAETIIAAKNESREALIGEASDLVYHLLVLMVERGTTLDELRDELMRRRTGDRK
jgi:phosphoribosyl-AMP cyclohydrolase / phosphoribosyl-ATP pyrophosphohydrolase